MKRSKKLVPLMPILVRLGACDEAREWLAMAKYTTFREAYESIHKSGDSRMWLPWLGTRIAREHGLRDCPCPLCEGSRDIPGLAARVERALYDYAVREGLA